MSMVAARSDNEEQRLATAGPWGCGAQRTEQSLFIFLFCDRAIPPGLELAMMAPSITTKGLFSFRG